MVVVVVFFLSSQLTSYWFSINGRFRPIFFLEEFSLLLAYCKFGITAERLVLKDPMTYSLLTLAKPIYIIMGIVSNAIASFSLNTRTWKRKSLKPARSFLVIS